MNPLLQRDRLLVLWPTGAVFWPTGAAFWPTGAAFWPLSRAWANAHRLGRGVPPHAELELFVETIVIHRPGQTPNASAEADSNAELLLFTSVLEHKRLDHLGGYV